jgi:hypothetical protein
MLGYLQQIWGLSIYLEAISNGMLSMLSWSKDPSWRHKEKEGKDKTQSDEPTVPQLQGSVQSSDELVHRVKP